jgi:hypothetical protein
MKNKEISSKVICLFLGSPFSCYISDLSCVTVSDSLTSAPVGLPLSFDIRHEDFYNYHNQNAAIDVVITGRIRIFQLEILYAFVSVVLIYFKLHRVVLFL